MNLDTVKNLGVKEEDIMSLLNLYLYKGKDFYYAKVFEKDQGKIVKKNVNKDILALATLFNLDVSEARKKYIIKNGGTGKNKDEQFLINIRNSLYAFVNNYENFEFAAFEITHFVEKLFYKIKEVKPNVFFQKDSKNALFDTKTKVFQRDLLDKMFNAFVDKKDSKKYEITNLIVNFYIDFLNQNIFTSDNDILGLFILYMLLITSGFTVFRYESFFELYNKYQAEFKDGTLCANQNYEDGYSNTTKLTKTLIKIILEAYESLEKYLHEYTYDSKTSKENEIINIIYHLPQEFTKEDVRKQDVFASDSTINRALQSLQVKGVIRSLGTGRSAKWIRVVNDPVYNNTKNTSIFDFDTDENNEDPE